MLRHELTSSPGDGKEVETKGLSWNICVTRKVTCDLVWVWFGYGFRGGPETKKTNSKAESVGLYDLGLAASTTVSKINFLGNIQLQEFCYSREKLAKVACCQLGLSSK